LALVGLGAPVLSANLAGQLSSKYAATAFLRISAVGAGPLHYQWRFDSVAITGATNSFLFLSNIQLHDAGTYTVVVSNSLGNVSSSELNLAVVPLYITAEPQDQSVVRGRTLNLSLEAVSPLPVDYRWYCNGADLPGATNNPLLLVNAQPGQSGTYWVVLSNALGLVRSHDVHISIGRVIPWGDNSANQLQYPPGLSNVVAITAGHLHNLALKADGTVIAWGDDYSRKAEVPSDLTNAIGIAAGEFHSLALKRDGTVAGWGNDAYGQVSGAVGLTNIIAISAGYEHSMALTADGKVLAWGENSSGQTSVPTLSDVVAIAAGWSFCLALRKNGTVVAWGEDTAGQCWVPWGLHNVVAIAAGQNHSLALEANGTVVGWGDNYGGEISPPLDLNNAIAIAAGGAHSLALRSDGTVTAWGYNGSGQTDVPILATNALAISAGTAHSVALLGDPPRQSFPLLPTLSPGASLFRFSVPSQRGALYSLDFKNALTDPDWAFLSLAVGTGGNLILEDATATNSMRFYRVHHF
jgi:hypothetical protein